MEREAFVKHLENKMLKNYGKEAVKCEKRFALPETIYDKEFHFFNSTLQDYKENLQFQRLNSEEEKKERKIEARSLENDKKVDKKNKTIESHDEMTTILEEINNARKNDKADATSIQLCQSPVQKLVEQKAPISVGNRKEAEEAGSTISKTPPFGEIYKGTSMQYHLNSSKFPDFLRARKESRFNFTRSEGPDQRQNYLDPDEIIVPVKIKNILESRLRTLSKKDAYNSKNVENLLDLDLNEHWITQKELF